MLQVGCQWNAFQRDGKPLETKGFWDRWRVGARFVTFGTKTHREVLIRPRDGTYRRTLRRRGSSDHRPGVMAERQDAIQENDDLLLSARQGDMHAPARDVVRRGFANQRRKTRGTYREDIATSFASASTVQNARALDGRGQRHGGSAGPDAHRSYPVWAAGSLAIQDRMARMTRMSASRMITLAARTQLSCLYRHQSPRCSGSTPPRASSTRRRRSPWVAVRPDYRRRDVTTPQC